MPLPPPPCGCPGHARGVRAWEGEPHTEISAPGRSGRAQAWKACKPRLPSAPRARPTYG